MKTEMKTISRNGVNMNVRFDDIEGEGFLSIESKVDDKYLLFTANAYCGIDPDCDLFISSKSQIETDMDNIECHEMKIISIKEEYKGTYEKEIEEMRLTMLDLMLEYFNLDEEWIFDMWNSEGIYSVDKDIQANKWVYCIELEPNYSFSGSGTDKQYFNSYSELKQLLQSIVHCDSE